MNKDKMVFWVTLGGCAFLVIWSLVNAWMGG